jgi:hypothetical protein
MVARVTTKWLLPGDGDGSAAQWARFGANAKARFSKTEAHFGSALAPNLPILVSNDGRLLPQTFEGGTIQSKEIDNLTINAGQLTHAMGRARATVPVCRSPVPDSNKFRYGGLDYKLTPDLTLQYYYSNLEDFYKQHFLGATHVFKIADDQSFKTDLRYFDSSSDGKNGNDSATTSTTTVATPRTPARSTTRPGPPCSPTPWVATR